MTVLFNPIGQSFSGVTLAGSGTITQWTYTVPALKRSVAVHCTGVINASAAAAGTGLIRIIATIGGVQVTLISLSNQAVLAASISQSVAVTVYLSAGDTLAGVTTNTAAVNITMTVQAAIQEFQ